MFHPFCCVEVRLICFWITILIILDFDANVKSGIRKVCNILRPSHSAAVFSGAAAAIAAAGSPLPVRSRVSSILTVSSAILAAVDLVVDDVAARKINRRVAVAQAEAGRHVADAAALPADELRKKALRDDVVAQHHAVGTFGGGQSQHVPGRRPAMLEAVALEIEIVERNPAFRPSAEKLGEARKAEVTQRTGPTSTRGERNPRSRSFSSPIQA